MYKCKKFVVNNSYEELAQDSNLQIVEEKLSALNEGEFLARAVYISVDPQLQFTHLSKGDCPAGTQIAKIIESKNLDFPVGKHVVGEYGWRNYTIDDGKKGFPSTWIVPDDSESLLPLFLSVLGKPGLTAYFGLLDICKPKPGEIVISSGASSVTGTCACAIAKIAGCQMFAIAGSEARGKWLADELKVDGWVCCQWPNFEAALQKMTPTKVDCFFDNAGREMASMVIKRMNDFGRIASQGVFPPHSSTVITAPIIQYDVVSKQLKLEGFKLARWKNVWMKAYLQNKKWYQEGKLKYKQTFVNGFENCMEAFKCMLDRKNVGGYVVKI